MSKQYAKGGKLGRLYSGEEDEEYPNQLVFGANFENPFNYNPFVYSSPSAYEAKDPVAIKYADSTSPKV